MFLYPHLGIKRGVSITPVETYISWKDMYSLKDCKFISVYHLRDDPEFKAFEDKMLIGNKLFHDFKELEDNKAAYIFDFSEHDLDFKKIINGKYSLLSPEYKAVILKFYQNHKHVESYLHPDRYFYEYSSLLAEPRDVKNMVELLMNVGELCALPDLSKEVLEVSEKVLTFENVSKI